MWNNTTRAHEMCPKSEWCESDWHKCELREHMPGVWVSCVNLCGAFVGTAAAALFTGMTRQDATRHNTTRRDTVRHDITQRDATRHEITSPDIQDMT